MNILQPGMFCTLHPGGRHAEALQVVIVHVELILSEDCLGIRRSKVGQKQEHDAHLNRAQFFTIHKQTNKQIKTSVMSYD